MLPDPSLLDPENWENGVLPEMGPRLGIFNHGFKEYCFSRNDMNLPQGFYPSGPVLSQEDWQYIIDYYTSVSPDSLGPLQRQHRVSENVNLFTVETPSIKMQPPTSCFVRVDTTVFPHQLLVADVISKNLFRFNDHLSLLDTVKTISPPVDMEIRTHELVTCNIGVMNPNNGKYGSIGKINVDERGKMIIDTTLKIENLARPVQLTSADLNKDGRMDYVVCEFGHLVGALSWMENKGNKFERHVLRAFPGAIQSYIRDVNKDGLPDIWVLFSQGEEGVFLFINKGNGEFSEKQVLRFQPIFGSSSFELVDFDKDGVEDIVYTCGDNADYSPALKPYHGIYIFINDGHNNFQQKYFFPMYGCFKAIARDFDGDGDLDIAAISFFADYTRHPEESFIYLENKGNFDFLPYTIPNTSSGRWLTMDAGDIDGDGKTDLVIGNFSIAPASIKAPVGWKQGPLFIVLKNIMIK
ncbi:MAG TPA: VCBS repeat-containing protein [Chitinophagaceae bacterium]|nr:VCBS repeat-containing protein [Chitinophagaceae bacterium]